MWASPFKSYRCSYFHCYCASRRLLLT
uniref:Uncharacterized protein n=1 Tax=Arundo donax TaxID=35708 RepID=A0A0A9FPP6_ARUDO